MSDIPWGVSAMGGDVVGCGIAELALRRGGHIHVGLEAYTGPRQPTNAELVAEVVALAERWVVRRCITVNAPTSSASADIVYGIGSRQLASVAA